MNEISSALVQTEQRPRLLYLPGLDGTGRLLHRQPALHDAYQVVAASYPHESPATYEELAAGALRQMNTAAGDRPFVVLAESFGGAVALTLTLQHPQRVSRLVLVNTFAYFPARLRIQLAARLGRFFPARPSPPTTRPLRGIFFFGPDIPPSERDVWWDRTSGVPMSAYGWRLRLIAGLDLRPRLWEITVPALVLTAPNDRVVPPAAGRELARFLPRARLLQPRAGHAALIHPRVDIARLLADPSYWEPANAAAKGGTP